ncbi:histidine triad (HIT) protein [Amycolatopsis sp. NBC_00438]|uniref:histidine triad (HIT) protein n=1 Tax=Amycolatopsis sp. NBC_00438 TaxID=2903558 RepID=UPI002E1BDBB0
MPAGPCPICAKHRGGGPLASPEVRSDDQVAVTHRAEPDLLGCLFVEPRRHVAGLDELAEDEAIARAVWVAARALRASSIRSPCTPSSRAHVHQHVFGRHRGTPAGNGRPDVDRPGAPPGTRPGCAAG